MSKLTNALLAPYNFFFGEDGIFASSSSQRRGQQHNQALYFGLPAVVFAILGVLFLIVGELSAGKTLIKRYAENVEEIRIRKTELNSSLNQELKMAQATQSPIASDPEILSLSNELSQKVNSEQIMLNKLYSLNPDEPKHLFELALTFLTKSNLTLLSSAKNKVEVATSQKDQSLSIMKRIAPLDKPGFLEAHLFLANDLLKSKAKSAKEQFENIRLASAHLDNALIRDQENTSALRMKVMISQSLGQRKEAKAFLQKLFGTDPFVYPQLCQVNATLGVGKDNLAILHSAREKLSGEITRMSGASNHRTKHLTYLVDCLHRLENFDEADGRVRAEMQEFPDTDRIQRWGNSLLAIGQQLRYQSARPITRENANELVSYLREGHRLDPNNERILDFIVELGGEDIPGLAKISKDIYQPGPTAPASVANLLGTIALKKKDYFEAVKQFKKANDKAPDNPKYLNNLSYVYLARPDPDPREALKLVEKAIRSVRAGKIKSKYLSNFYDTEGRALLAIGKIAEANGDQELATSRYTAGAAKLLLALKDRPENSEIAQGIVECYEAAGHTKQVKVWSEQVKKLQAIEAQADATQ